MIECPQCGKFFSRRDNLLRHIKIVHDREHKTITEQNDPLNEAVTVDKQTNGDSPSNFDMERINTVQEAIKTKTKRMNGSMAIEERTSPQTIKYVDRAPKRMKLSEDTKNDEINDSRTKTDADSQHEYDEDMKRPQKYENINIDSEFQETDNIYDHTTESDDSQNSYEGSSKAEEETSNEESYTDDYSTSDDDANIGPTTTTIYWNDPNKLVDRLRELVTPKIGHEIFKIVAELKKGNIIE